jgi:hypothetical protein
MLYITGDLHGEMGMSRLSNKNIRLTKDDVLLQTGDFGLLWYSFPSPSEKYWLAWLEKKPFTFCFIDGNHENHEMLERLEVVDFCGGKAGKVRSNIYHLKRGEIYTIQDIKIFTFGGADSVDKLHRKEGISWWRNEVASYSEMEHGFKNIDNNNGEVDIVITHTLPNFLVKQIQRVDKFNDPTSAYLDEVSRRLKFTKWYTGHFHIDETFGKFTIVYKAVLPVIL